jgi:RimJ/RimL family protein N-acetyltransferase
VSSVPVLETPRLRLRRHELSDFAATERLWGDPSVVRYIGGVPALRSEAWARLLRYVGHWELQGYGYWLVEERATGAFVGEVGLAEARREIVPSIEGIPEAGWVLAPAMQGKGYAGEALDRVLRWSDTERGFPETVCLIAPEHVRSIRTAERAGFAFWKAGVYRDRPASIYRRLNSRTPRGPEGR